MRSSRSLRSACAVRSARRSGAGREAQGLFALPPSRGGRSTRCVGPGLPGCARPARANPSSPPAVRGPRCGAPLSALGGFPPWPSAAGCAALRSRRGGREVLFFVVRGEKGCWPDFPRCGPPFQCPLGPPLAPLPFATSLTPLAPFPRRERERVSNSSSCAANVPNRSPPIGTVYRLIGLRLFSLRARRCADSPARGMLIGDAVGNLALDVAGNGNA